MKLCGSTSTVTRTPPRAGGAAASRARRKPCRSTPRGAFAARRKRWRPRNSAIGVVIAFFASIAGFALIWRIWWLAIIALLGAAITLLVFGWLDDREREIPAAEMAETEQARSGRRQLA